MLPFSWKEGKEFRTLKTWKKIKLLTPQRHRVCEGSYDGRSWTKCSTRRFVMAFRRFCITILLVESFSEFDSPFQEVDSSLQEFVSSSCQFNSSTALFDSSLYEFNSSLIMTTLLRHCVVLLFRHGLYRFDLSTERGCNIRLQIHKLLVDSMH